MELPPSPTPLSNQLTSGTPDWLYYTMAFMGIVIAMLIAVILVMVIRHR